MTLSGFSRGLGATALLFALTSSPARAQSVNDTANAAVSLSEQWQTGAGIVAHGEDGKVVFLYGNSQPSIVCSPLQVCDIELARGELVHDVLIGDTVRWKVEPAVSGAAGSETVHLVLKPAEAGLKTSMVVTTSVRTYHIELRSDAEHYMARVGFEYPDEVNEKLAQINARVSAVTLPGVGVTADQLDFSFRMTGSARWRPTRIYSDGAKTYIQFPASLSGQDAPVLFVVSGGQNRIVNYRLAGTLMIVDYSIDHAVLVSGVGPKSEKITIRRGT